MFFKDNLKDTKHIGDVLEDKLVPVNIILEDKLAFAIVDIILVDTYFTEEDTILVGTDLVGIVVDIVQVDTDILEDTVLVDIILVATSMAAS